MWQVRPRSEATPVVPMVLPWAHHVLQEGRDEGPIAEHVGGDDDVAGPSIQELEGVGGGDAPTHRQAPGVRHQRLEGCTPAQTRRHSRCRSGAEGYLGLDDTVSADATAGDLHDRGRTWRWKLNLEWERVHMPCLRTDFRNCCLPHARLCPESHRAGIGRRLEWMHDLSMVHLSIVSCLNKYT